jgi:hypothetical protein
MDRRSAHPGVCIWLHQGPLEPFRKGDRAHLIVFGVTTALIYGAISAINPTYSVLPDRPLRRHHGVPHGEQRRLRHHQYDRAEARCLWPDEQRHQHMQRAAGSSLLRRRRDAEPDAGGRERDRSRAHPVSLRCRAHAGDRGDGTVLRTTSGCFRGGAAIEIVAGQYLSGPQTHRCGTGRSIRRC